ncbi:ABC transporter ATP-binding protein [uncultured Pseudodesulfovibrio sp.]|uniref:ABC transporter ATP-binding protein n=1 Tax=uncultured Pseudodesulfovibrio sp. TaxID=2035858 RepID=UPI0029C76889|nr:ABC transporter ATP-binding protein [uncultured Pseudodesulfovibrio sp.]
MFSTLLLSIIELRRILRLLSSSLQIRTAFIFLLLFVQSLLELGFILTLTDMGLALTDSASLCGSFLYRGLFYLFPSLKAWAANSHHLLLLAGGVVIFVCLFKNIINYFAAKGIALLSEDISLSIGIEIMERYLYRDYAWHLSPASGLMYQRMLWRRNLALMLTHMLTYYACILTLIVLFLSLVGQEPLLTTLVISITSVVGVILYRSIRHSVDSSAADVASSAEAETKALLCATKGIREVLIYRQQPAFLEALEKATLKGREPRTFVNIAPTLPTWILEFAGFGVVVICIAVMIYVQQATTTRITAALALLLLTAWRVLPFCNRIVSLQISVRGLRPMTDAVVTLLEDLRRSATASFPPPDPNFVFNESICLRNVSFKYRGAKEDSLKNINIEIRKGERIGIIGPSGSGKSTLAGALSGLLPISSGDFLVNGQELTAERAAAFAAQIGYVPQTPFLFAGTLAENVAFSSWGKGWDEERIRDACKQAAVDFVDTHPQGVLQPIGENGAGLSGGQAQRISIARAMYAKPSLIIFDEATSALDHANENSIQRTIDSLAETVTCVMIAHRLSTVENCDNIIWLDNGQIVMIGSSRDVLAKYVLSQDTPNAIGAAL